MSNDIVTTPDPLGQAIANAVTELRRKQGRPTDFNAAGAGRIIQGLQDGETLSAVCKQDGMPAVGSVYRWLDEYQGFREAYIRARTYQSHAFADQALETPDKALDALQGDKSDSARVNAYRVKYEALKWRAGVHAPEYRDKQQGTGQSGMSVSLSISGLEKGKPIDIDVVGS